MNVVTEKKKFDDSLIKVAECVVGDSTGCGTLIARNEQLDIVKEGATITILNALARVQNKFLKIDLDKWSNIKPSDEVSSCVT